MPPKLFFSLTCLTIAAAVACSSNADGGRTTNATPQPSATTTVPTTTSATPPAPAAAANPDAEACKLLTSEDVQAVQGEGLKSTKGSDSASGALATSQCFYETANFTNSISLTLTRRNGDAKGEGPREFWKKNFGGDKDKEREKEGREKRDGREKKEGGARVEEEEEGVPPARVKGVGDEAYWVGASKVGTLYVLKGERFLRISVGGADAQEKKMEKSKTLARRALKRV
jgi:hypothetical protein